jgi:hypothetical protein
MAEKGQAFDCHQRTIMNADHLPDDLPIRSLGPVWCAGAVVAVELMCDRIGGRLRTSGTFSAARQVISVAEP